MLVNMKEMLDKAYENKYAVAQFNINNLEWTRYILEECNRISSPVILGVSEGASNYMGGYKTVTAIVINLIDYLDIRIPVCLHLDHAKSFESCKEAIEAGFTSVMIDASSNLLEDNIKITKEVVDYAQKNNVTVEGEIGHIGENGNDIVYADMLDSVRYVQETGIDFLAPAIGSAHGLYKGKPNLNFDLIKSISDSVNVPLVLHGGTGIYDEQLKKAIDLGISKININTELQVAWTNSVRDYLKENLDVYDPRKVIKSGEKAIKKCIYNKLLLLGSANINK